MNAASSNILNLNNIKDAKGVHGAGRFFFDHNFNADAPNSSLAYGLYLHYITSIEVQNTRLDAIIKT